MRKEEQPEDLLGKVFIAAPCSVSWDSMTGDEKSRHCSKCSKNVYNLSAMSTKEAKQFLAETRSLRPCLQFYRRDDGTILTDNCPVGLRKLRDRIRRVAQAACAFASLLISAGQSAFAEVGVPVYCYHIDRTSGNAPKELTQTQWPKTLLKISKTRELRGMPAMAETSLLPVAPKQQQAIPQNESSIGDVGPALADDPDGSGYMKLSAQVDINANSEAFATYQQGKENEEQGNFFLAATCYQDALKKMTGDALQSVHAAPYDPRFRELVENHLRHIQSFIVAPENVNDK